MYIQTQRRPALLQGGAVASSALAFISGCILGALLVKLTLAAAPSLLAGFGQAAREAGSLTFLQAFSLCVRFPLLFWLLIFWRRGSLAMLLLLLIRGAIASFFLGCMTAAVTGGFSAGLVMLFFHCLGTLPMLLLFSSLAGSIRRAELYWRQPGRWRAALLLLLLALMVGLLCALGEWQVRPRLLAMMK